MKKHALILTWTGFQDHELVYPYYRLLEDNFRVEIVADKKDDLGRFYGIFGLNMPCHLLLSEFKENSSYWMRTADLLVLPGGVKALEKLRQDKEITQFIHDWNLKGKIISSTCHGAQLLISAKVTQGRNITGYYSLEDDIVNSGAKYINQPVVVDKNIITSPHYDYMGDWMKQTLKSYYESKN